MKQMRFLLASCAALSFGVTVAHAQPAPAASPAPATQRLPARIDDIQIARDGETVSVLVKLSAQPAAASAKVSGETLTLEIDGISLTPISLTPPAGSLVTRVDGAIGRLTLSGAAFGSATTVIYRNAVLIEAKLAEPALKGSSLMTASTQATPIVLPTPAASAPAPAKAPEPKPEPAKAQPAPPPPAAPAPKPDHPVSTAALANVDAARCTTAAAELAKDAWALAAMGDLALCLIDQGRTDEAKNRLDQLAAITPQDWRVALGRAALDAKSGDAAKAEAGYRNAAEHAPSDEIRAAINQKFPVALKPAPPAVQPAAAPVPPHEANPEPKPAPAQQTVLDDKDGPISLTPPKPPVPSKPEAHPAH